MPLTKAEKTACQAAGMDPSRLLVLRRATNKLNAQLVNRALDEFKPYNELAHADVASIAAFKAGVAWADKRWQDAISNDNAYSACATYPREHANLRDKIEADDCVQHKNEYTRSCDCCDGKPIAVLPLFNRFKHTARLCEVCLQQALATLEALRDDYLADGP